MTPSRRILITGLASAHGGRLAQLLERHAQLETLIGIDTDDPRHELQRTEFVRVGADGTLLRRIIRAARIDTIVDTRLSADPPSPSARRAHELNVAGTRSVLAAAGGRDSSVRKVVFKSSAVYYGAERDDPAFFTEEMPRSHSPRGPIEQTVVQAEEALAAFAAENPHTTVTVLRAASEVGGESRTAHTALLGLPVVPTILGFDPRWQFVHEDDVIGALAHAALHQLPGAYNVAGDGVLALSEVVSLLGKPLMPVLPPWGTVFAGAQLRRVGLRVPVELLRELRHGRGLDNRRLKSAGYALRYTSREAVLKLRAQQRLRPLLGRGDDRYRYEREVEEFLRWSPSVQQRRAPGIASDAVSGDGVPNAGAFEALTEAELLEIIPSLESGALQRLRDHELSGAARRPVLDEIEHQLALRSSLTDR